MAVVTSPTGAAIRDFLEVLRRRWSGVDVLIIPARVQGQGAAGEIAEGIRVANRLANPPDTIVVGRGGGSLEDLWCFNEEVVVRAIAASQIPLVSAVGHEIDVTLADLAADVRALTPSEAAELIAPAAADLKETAASWEHRLHTSMNNRLRMACETVQRFSNHRIFKRGFVLIDDAVRRVDELESQLTRAIGDRSRLAEHAITSVAARLETLSPLAVLGRGYSVTTNAKSGQVLKSVDDVSTGDELRTTLQQGEVRSRVV